MIRAAPLLEGARKPECTPGVADDTQARGSTAPEDAAYSDVRYVEELIAPDAISAAVAAARD